MLVVIVILGIVSAVVSAAIISSLRVQQVTESNVTSTSAARTAIERMSRDIRTANPLVTAQANLITFDMYYGTRCERRTYSVVSGSLVLSRAQFAAGVRCGAYGAVPGAATTTTVIENVTNSTATPLFRYYRWDSATKTRVESPAPVTSGVGSVDTVRVDALVSALRQGDVGVQTLVDLRNVELK
jgi:type II secretory pathway pseudopilin PulG